jgi:hypothetical protein
MTKLSQIMSNIHNIVSYSITLGTLLVAQLVEALRYKPKGIGFHSRWCQWNFSLI